MNNIKKALIEFAIKANASYVSYDDYKKSKKCLKDSIKNIKICADCCTQKTLEDIGCIKLANCMDDPSYDMYIVPNILTDNIDNNNDIYYLFNLYISTEETMVFLKNSSDVPKHMNDKSSELDILPYALTGEFPESIVIEGKLYDGKNNKYFKPEIKNAYNILCIKVKKDEPELEDSMIDCSNLTKSKANEYGMIKIDCFINDTNYDYALVPRELEHRIPVNDKYYISKPSKTTPASIEKSDCPFLPNIWICEDFYNYFCRNDKGYSSAVVRVNKPMKVRVPISKIMD